MSSPDERLTADADSRSNAVHLPEVEQLLALLTPTRVDGDNYVMAPKSDRMLKRTYGGLVIAQAFAAAAHGLDGKFLPQSLHGYFVDAGRLDQQLEAHVERVRDGRSFAMRRATVTQAGSTVFVLDASFHVREPGEDHAPYKPVAAVGPAESPSFDFGRFGIFAAFDLRKLKLVHEHGPSAAQQPVHGFWARCRGSLPDDDRTHASILAYVSDYGPVPAAHMSIGAAIGNGTALSLDHSIWFHRPVRMDEWVRIDLHAISNAGSRGLVLGFVHSEDGTLLATYSQEVLVRTNGVSTTSASKT